MRKKSVSFPFLAVFLPSLIGLGLLQRPEAAIIPVQAKLIRTMEIESPSAGPKLVQMIQETYLRNSQGSIYQKSDLIDPDTHQATLWLVVVTSPDYS